MNCDGYFGAADLQCFDCPKDKEKAHLSNTALDIYKNLSEKYWDLFTSLPKFAQRYIIWKKWNENCSNSKYNKLLVLFGLSVSPTFENLKSWYYSTQNGTNLWVLSVDLSDGPDFVNINKKLNINKKEKE